MIIRDLTGDLWPSLEFLARCEKIKNIQIFICKYETGIFCLRMALDRVVKDHFLEDLDQRSRSKK